MQQHDIPAGYHRISVKALIYDETRQKILLTKTASGYWDLPGGGLDWFESPEECVRREMKEEMGIDLISINPKPVLFFPWTDENVKYAYVIYEVTLPHLNFKESDECTEINFFGMNNIENLQKRPNLESIFLNIGK